MRFTRLISSVLSLSLICMLFDQPRAQAEPSTIQSALDTLEYAITVEGKGQEALEAFRTSLSSLRSSAAKDRELVDALTARVPNADARMEITLLLAAADRGLIRGATLSEEIARVLETRAETGAHWSGRTWQTVGAVTVGVVIAAAIVGLVACSSNDSCEVVTDVEIY